MLPRPGESDTSADPMFLRPMSFIRIISVLPDDSKRSLAAQSRPICCARIAELTGKCGWHRRSFQADLATRLRAEILSENLLSKNAVAYPAVSADRVP